MEESIADFSGFDFRSQWVGREKVTEVEKELLRDSLEGADRRRILELGSGFGRLLDLLLEMGDEVVASDFDLGSLAGISSPDGHRKPALRIAANLYHLPFADGAFTSATMIRVHHLLEDPVAAFQEIGRVLRNGSRLILSHRPRPSMGTLVNDIQRAIHRTAPGGFRSLTFARGSAPDLPWEPFPVFVGHRARASEEAARAGFVPVGEWVSGIEQYYLMRFLPTRFFVRFGRALGRAPGFPNRFSALELRKRSNGPIPPLEDALVCPRCRTPLPIDTAGSIRCTSCSFLGSRLPGVLDLRWVPPGARKNRAFGSAT